MRLEKDAIGEVNVHILKIHINDCFEEEGDNFDTNLEMPLIRNEKKMGGFDVGEGQGTLGATKHLCNSIGRNTSLPH